MIFFQNKAYVHRPMMFWAIIRDSYSLNPQVKKLVRWNSKRQNNIVGTSLVAQW